MFTKWLGAARTARRRRVTLQQCEEEMKNTRLLIAWDKWRERYQDIQLRPLVSRFSCTILDPTDEYLAGGVFCSPKANKSYVLHLRDMAFQNEGKSWYIEWPPIKWCPHEYPRLFQSLPALRFNASHLKKKYWSAWRNAMPQAFQSKKARDFDRNTLLSAWGVDLIPCLVNKIVFVQTKSSRNGPRRIGLKWH